MTAVYIIGGILLFLFILLIIPVSADVGYSDRFKITVKYGGIKVFQNKKPENVISVPAVKQEQKPAKTKKKPEKENFISRIFKEKGKIEGIKFCFSLIKIAFSRIIWVVKRIKFKRVFLGVSVASDDAANTAVSYGALCAVVYPLINFIDQNSGFGVKKVNIYTDFDKLSPEIEFSVLAKTRLIYAVVAAVSMLFAYLRLKKESDKNGRK